MDQLRYSIELAKFAERSALSELEAAKAAVRTKEIEYEASRFALDWTIEAVKEQEKRKVPAPVPVLS